MLVENNRCIGCGNCALSCPIKCIQMQFDSEGFRYPIIDNSKCVHCNLCEKKCPIINKVDLSVKTNAFATKNKDNNVRRKSSSGGVFFALAEKVIINGGVVCAARYDGEFNVIHEVFDNREDISKYQGAKYAQSEVAQCFFKIKEILNNNRYVLFVGTPCQVAALITYLDEDYQKLIVVDMICHGVPSPKVWRQYLEERSNIDANGERLQYINLRSKSTGWSSYAYSVEFRYENGVSYSVRQDYDSYMQGFVSNLYLRDACANCEFKGIERCSDLTLGDYWGIWNQYPEFDDNKGVSALLIHTEKGKRIWNMISREFMSKEVSAKEIIQYNPSAVNISVPHPKRAEFFKGLEEGTSVIGMIEEYVVKKDQPQTSLIKRLLKKLFLKI